MNTTIVADYINSTEEDSRVRRRLGKAIKRFHQVRDETFAHAPAIVFATVRVGAGCNAAELIICKEPRAPETLTPDDRHLPHTLSEQLHLARCD
jgi:hypothetical protein